MSSFNILQYKSLESTNETLKRLVVDGAEDRSVVVAVRQTHGKGRQGKRWLEGEGNLYCSILLRNPGKVSDMAVLPLIAAICCAEAIGNNAKVKWPNDIMVNGKKAGGILLESSLTGNDIDWVVIGIGINIKNAPEDGAVDYPATSLRENGITLSRDTCLRNILENLESYYPDLIEKGELKENWLNYDVLYNKPIKVETVEETLSGTHKGITQEGALLVELEDGSVKEFHQATTIRAA